MIFRYTPEEIEQSKKINERYMTLLDKSEKELFKHSEDSKAFAALLEKRDKLESQYFSEIEAFDKTAAKRRFAEFNGDLEKIITEARRQVDITLEWNLQQGYMTDFDGENILPEPVLQLVEPEIITSLEARELIKKTIELFISFLEENNYTAELKELNQYISEHISKSPYVRVSKNDLPTSHEEIIREIRRPLMPIKTYGFMNDKASNKLISDNVFIQEINGQTQLICRVNQSTQGKAKQVIVTTALTFEGTNAKMTKRMTAFDNAVYNAISTSFYHHRREVAGRAFYITPQEIWRIMNGTQDTNKNPSTQQVEKVCDSMDKMRFTRLYMDITAELEANFISLEDDRLKKGVIDTYLLKSDKVSFTTEKGKEAIGYKIDAEPILYTYNAAKDHVLFVDFELLDTSKKTGNEGATIEIRNYLLQQITLMNTRNRNNTRILFNTIYEATGIDDPQERNNREDFATEKSFKSKVRQDAKKDRDKITAILEDWKEKNFINDFTEVRKGKAIVGVDIELNPDKMKKLSRG